MADRNANKINEIRDLANPNWKNPNDRRRIAACLVNVVYLLEKKKGKETAKEWCGILKFDVEKEIKDETICGAIFQWVGTRGGGGGAEEPPLKVVAFRGTIRNGEYILGKDFHHNWKAVMAHHGSIRRAEIGLKHLPTNIESYKPQSIWIVGHSLGAAIATTIVRKLKREEREKIEAHLFNPPFLSPRLPEVKFFEIIGRNLSLVRDGQPSVRFPLLEGVYNTIEGACKWAAVRLGLKDDKILLDLYDKFIGVSSWIPNIYVNKDDPISCSYIRYFEVMQGIYEKKGQPLHERMKYLFCYEVAKKRTPWHLLPSAKLFVRKTNDHTLSQWWLSNIQLESKDYVPPSEVTQWKPNTIETNAILPSIAK